MGKKEEGTPARQKILEAARSVFISKGMAGARMQDIADAAGINKALLHYYFRDKQKLFETIFIEISKSFFPKLNSILQSEKPVLDKIEMICVAYISQIEEIPFLPVFILSEASRQPEAFVKKMWSNSKPPVKAFFDMIETAVRKEEIKPVHPMQLLLNILSLSIFPFVARPLLQQVTGINKKQFDALMQERKKTVPQLIIQSIKK